MTIPTQAKFQAAGLRNHVGAWQEVTKDHICLQAISGVKIPLVSTPPLRLATKEKLGRRETDPVVDEAIRELLELGAIQIVPRDTKVFLSRVFTVAKTERGKEYGRRFILNLKVSSPRYYLESQEDRYFMPLCDSLESVLSYSKLRYLYRIISASTKPFYLQPFNKRFVRKSPFTMPGVYEVPDTLMEGSWAIKIDFKHGRISILTDIS